MHVNTCVLQPEGTNCKNKKLQLVLKLFLWKEKRPPFFDLKAIPFSISYCVSSNEHFQV